MLCYILFITINLINDARILISVNMLHYMARKDDSYRWN